MAWAISCSAPARALETSPRLVLRSLGAPLGRRGIIAQTAELGLAVAQIDSEAHHVASRLVALQGGRHLEFFGFDVLRGGLFERRLASAKLFFNVMERRLRFRSRALELQYFGVQRAQFAFHAERARFRRTAAADDAALIRRAVGRHERIRGILAREALGHRGLFHQERRLQPRQKLLRRRAQRIAKFHQTIEARNGFPFDLEGHDRLVRLQIQLAQRIHEKRRAAADFVAQHGNARAGHVKGFDDDVLQLVAQKLFDGALVFLLDFGIVGQHADGAESGGFIAVLARSE